MQIIKGNRMTSFMHLIDPLHFGECMGVCVCVYVCACVLLAHTHTFKCVGIKLYKVSYTNRGLCMCVTVRLKICYAVCCCCLGFKTSIVYFLCVCGGGGLKSIELFAMGTQMCAYIYI